MSHWYSLCVVHHESIICLSHAFVSQACLATAFLSLTYLATTVLRLLLDYHFRGRILEERRFDLAVKSVELVWKVAVSVQLVLNQVLHMTVSCSNILPSSWLTISYQTLDSFIDSLSSIFARNGSSLGFRRPCAQVTLSQVDHVFGGWGARLERICCQVVHLVVWHVVVAVDISSLLERATALLWRISSDPIANHFLSKLAHWYSSRNVFRSCVITASSWCTGVFVWALSVWWVTCAQRQYFFLWLTRVLSWFTVHRTQYFLWLRSNDPLRSNWSCIVKLTILLVSRSFIGAFHVN